jgi:hypothetical protein
VELLVVVGILSVMLMVGTLSMEWLLPDTRISAAARQLASMIEDARDDAIVNGRVVRIEYWLGDSPRSEQRFRTIRDALPGQEDDFEELEFDLTLKDLRLPDGVRVQDLVFGDEEPVTEGYQAVAVYPDGTTAAHIIHLYAEEIDAWTSVLVSGLLGEADVQEGRFDPESLPDVDFE